MRRDGSSNFGVNNRFGLFPSVSAGWLASSEPFFPKEKISFLKVRGSYGIVGNDKIGLFRYRALLGGEAVYSFNDQLITGIAIGAFGNQDLKWETTSQGNFGIDSRLFNDRLELTADYYVKQTRDLLFAPDISAIVGAYSAGSSPPIVNGGNVRNAGLELMLRYNSRPGSELSYSVGYTFTTIKNEVTALQQGVDFYEFGSFGVGGGAATRMQVGFPIGYFFGYRTLGVYQTEEEVSGRGVTQEGARAGDLIFADINGDETVNFSNNTDKTFLGSAIPEMTMGLQANASWKGVDVGFSLYASIGNEILRNYERQQPLANLLAYRIGRWAGNGSTNDQPRLTTAANKNGVLSDFFVEDGSFLRLRNLQVGYQVPQSITSKAGIKKFRFYAAGNNLVTLTRYRGFDPDFNSGSSLTGGVDLGFYPQARTIMFGLELTY
jgi:TonB-linked SusC/RagA family outer membrane protein